MQATITNTAFSNLPVQLDELPDYRGVETIRVESRYAKIVATIAGTIFGVIVCIALILALVVPGAGALVFTAVTVAAFVIGCLIVPLIYAYCRRIRYALRSHDIIVCKGVFFASETVQPLVRVQHVELKRGPLDKRYGLAALQIFSAGLGKETFTLPGLRLDDAQRIRSHVLGYSE